MGHRSVVGRVLGSERRRETREVATLLAGFPAFFACSAVELEALASAGQVIRLPAHWTFLHEGTPADACYVILEGEVGVRSRGAERAILGPGSVLGEMGLLGHTLRRASVVTTVAVRALRIEYDALTAVLDAHAPLAHCLSAVYAEHRAADVRAAAERARATLD